MKERESPLFPYLLRKDLDQPQKRFLLNINQSDPFPIGQAKTQKGKVQSRIEKGHEVSAFSLSRQTAEI